MRFAEVECPDLPLYRRLCLEVAEDAALLDRVMTAAPGQWRPNLLLAALHDLVLRDPSCAVAAWYPTVGGVATRDGDLMAAVHDTIEAHLDAFAAMLKHRSTQTNEVNRTALFRPAIGVVTAEIDDAADRGLAWVEVGASAGLNLAFDDYRIVYGGIDRTIGPPEWSPPLRCEVRGAVSSAAEALERGLAVPIAARLGYDLAPVDLTDPAARRWLKACIWPEQLDRHERFDAAADHVARLVSNGTIAVRRDDAVDGLSEAIETALDHAARNGFDDPVITVVNSWVMTYLPTDRRAAFDACLDLFGMDHTLVHLSAEGAGVEAWVPGGAASTEHTVVGATTWVDGVRSDRRLAVCHPHLAWLDWLDSSD